MKRQNLTDDEVFDMLRDWADQQWPPILINGVEGRLISREKIEAGIDFLRDRYAKWTGVPLSESTLAELKDFKRELLKGKGPHGNAFFAIEMFRSFRESVLKARPLRRAS